MKTLVLCVDRDNDIGEKGNVSSPVIGRDDNIKAALALGLADPGDTDTNSILAAVKLYDDLIAKGNDMEIATVAGDVDIGTTADEKLLNELDEVISKVHADGVYFVSDGAEDENILPLIQNFVKVRHVHRVVIKKQKTIEDTYYAIVRILDDDKMQRKFVAPTALLLIALGIIAITGYITYGLSLLAILFGLFLLIRVYKLEKPLMTFVNDAKHAIETKRYITTVSAFLALFLSTYGLILGLSYGMNNNPILTAVNILDMSIWYVMGALIIYILGVTIDTLIKEKRFIWPVVGIIFLIGSIGFLGTALLDIVYYLYTGDFSNTLESIFINTMVGISILTFGTILYKYIRSHAEDETPIPITWQR